MGTTVSTIYNLATGESVSRENFQAVKVGEYPQDWFDKNPHKKPSLTVPINDTDLMDLIKGFLKTDVTKFSLQQAKAILYKFMLTVTQELSDDWTSMGIMIGKAGETVTPAHLFEVTTFNLPMDGIKTVDEVDELAVIGAILLIYRLYQLPTNASITDIVGKISTRYQNIFSTPPPFSFQCAVQHLGYWDSDMDYRKLIAGFDFFFDKFPMHQYAKLRFGTLLSAWRDCTALKAVFEVYSFLGMSEISKLAPWLWEPSIQEDAWRLFAKPLKLSSDQLGYFLYTSDMGFVGRSVYSVTMNPAMHIFCQTIYCAFGHPRGLNARMVYLNQVQAVIKNGLTVAYAHANSEGWKIVICPKQDMAAYADLMGKADADRELTNFTSDSEEEESAPKEPHTRNAKSWYNYYKSVGTPATAEYIQFLSKVRSHCRQSRPGSVGKYIHDMLSTDVST